MKPNDWQRTEELFHAALELSADERRTYLAQACAQDTGLRAEVESLLAASERGVRQWEEPIFSFGMQVLSEAADDDLLTGKRIGPYQILNRIGKGGMGQVYLAEDTKLDRQVALKFLSGSLVDSAWAKRQLMKEAQAIARLDHPNICAVYGFEEYDDYNFMVMQYIEGETLAALIHGHHLEAAQMLHLITQIASALAEAQAHGIVHRDIKPQNIMVTAHHQVKVLDFGLAKFVQQKPSAATALNPESHSSQLGLIQGTVAYMSPEQLRGERLDFRSDLFSLGIVLYEMCSGSNPFSGASNADTISAILMSEPLPLKNLRGEIPAGLPRIIEKCLKKNREQRYPSASELLLDLTSPITQTVPVSPWRLPFTPRKAMLLAMLLALLLVLGSGIVWLTSSHDRTQTLAVLPIVNESAEANTALSQGLSESLVRKLSRLSKLRVKAPTTVGVNQEQKITPEEVGKALKVDKVLEGTLRQQGESLLLQIKLINVADGMLIWRQVYTINPQALLELEDELSTKLVSKLELTLNSDEQKLLSARQTKNEEAYDKYRKGRRFWQKRDKANLQKAIQFFEEALDEDPDYALAYSGLADSYVLLNSVAYGSLPTADAMANARFAANRALELDPTLCEAHTSMGIYQLRYEWNWQEAEREFKLAIHLNPNYHPAHFWYASLLALLGRSQEAIEESEIARELDPLSLISDFNLGRALYYARRYKEATEHFVKLLNKAPQDLKALYALGCLYQQQGLYQESINSLEKIYAIDPEFAAGPLGYTYAKVGRKADARKVLKELEALAKRKYIPIQEIALIHLGLDNRDQTFKLLNEACTEHFASLPPLLIDPLLDSIRSDPRFADLLRCARLTH